MRANGGSLEHELRSGGVVLNQLHTVALQGEHGPDSGADAGAAGPALFELLHQLSEGTYECRLVRVVRVGREVKYGRHGDGVTCVLEDVTYLGDGLSVIDLRERIVMGEFVGIESAFVG